MSSELVLPFLENEPIHQNRPVLINVWILAVLDLKKAYDSVPIGNILYKLDALGISGKMLSIYKKKLYLTSKASLKIDDQYSESFNIMKGVRQGYPLSPILFNLFINDIFNDFSICKME